MTSARVWSLWDLMESKSLAALLDGQSFIAATLQYVSLKPRTHEHFGFRDGEQLEYALKKYRSYRDALKTFGANVAARHADLLVESAEAATSDKEGHFEIAGRTYLTFRGALEYLCNLMSTEMETIKVMLLDPSHEHLLDESKPLFGEAIDEAFPDSADDIAEAGKCLALGLSTACVFHLMRAAEAAAAVVVKSFGGDTHKDGEPHTFGGLFKQVSDKVEAMPRGSDKDAWNKLKGFMSSLNRGDRTKVAHPGRLYTERQAERVFDLTRAFMEEAEELL